METMLLVLHYFICFFLIVAILLQAGKGADIGAVFGGASQTIFGSRGPTTFLNRITAVVAIAFLVTSISLAQISKNKSDQTVMDKAAATAVEVNKDSAANTDAAKPAPAATSENKAPAEGQPADAPKGVKK